MARMKWDWTGKSVVCLGFCLALSGCAGQTDQATSAKEIDDGPQGEQLSLDESAWVLDELILAEQSLNESVLQFEEAFVVNRDAANAKVAVFQRMIAEGAPIADVERADVLRGLEQLFEMVQEFIPQLIGRLTSAERAVDRARNAIYAPGMEGLGTEMPQMLEASIRRQKEELAKLREIRDGFGVLMRLIRNPAYPAGNAEAAIKFNPSTSGSSKPQAHQESVKYFRSTVESWQRAATALAQGAPKSQSDLISRRAIVGPALQECLRSARSVSDSYLDALHPRLRSKWRGELVPGLVSVVEGSPTIQPADGLVQIDLFWQWIHNVKHSFPASLLR